jgi:hypothetical protein
MTDILYEEFRRMAREIAALPPPPRAFLMHHSVPYGKLFRQWDTRGHLYVWVNPGEIFDLPVRAMYGEPYGAKILPEHLTGIPVVWG